jgi:stearoyl-CoA desaturase (Delta-9 desaturase)
VSRLHRNINISAVIVPFVAFLTAVPLLWNDLIGWTDLAILLALYLLSGFGITLGFHRLLTHRAFETYRPVRYLFAVLGTVAVQGPVIGWVADHRKHHAFTDEEGDPHSPHVGHGGGDGWRGALRGLWHAHVGWLFEYNSGREAERFAPDLLEDRGMVWISRLFAPIVAASLGLAFGLGYALTGELGGALTALLWGGSSASSSSTTSRGASTRSVTSLADGASVPTTSRRTSSGSRLSPLASPGTTTITHSRGRPGTACAGGRSIPAACSSGR